MILEAKRHLSILSQICEELKKQLPYCTVTIAFNSILDLQHNPARQPAAQHNHLSILSQICVLPATLQCTWLAYFQFYPRFASPLSNSIRYTNLLSILSQICRSSSSSYLWGSSATCFQFYPRFASRPEPVPLKPVDAFQFYPRFASK